jgi:hypothetical protein
MRTKRVCCVLCAGAEAIASGRGNAAALSEAVAQAGLQKVGPYPRG